MAGIKTLTPEQMDRFLAAAWNVIDRFNDQPAVVSVLNAKTASVILLSYYTGRRVGEVDAIQMLGPRRGKVPGTGIGESLRTKRHRKH